MTTYKKYDHYKDSGVEWLGEVPEHWKTQRLGTLFKLITTKSDDTYIQLGLEHIESITGFIIGEESSYQGSGVAFQPKDILFGKLRPYLRKVALVEKHGAAVGDFYVVRSQKNISPRYLRYRLLADSSIEPLNAFTYGAKMPRVGWEDFRNLEASRPPLPEQRAIADFLDRETAKVDALIEKKEKLIELLDEKRQALISHAVTKGLNPNAPMKDSGVPWLGEVPAHWEVRRLRYACDAIKTGGTPAIEYLDYPHDDAIEWFTPGDFNDSLSSKKSSRRVGPAVSAKQAISIFPAGSVLIVSIGATVGKVLRLYASASANQQINALIPRMDVNSDFLLNKMISTTDIIRSIATASTLPIINQARLGEIPIAVPSSKEQQQIIEYIQNNVSSMNRLKKSTAHSIALLREKRSALITAAVTGQIDVRGEVA